MNQMFVANLDTRKKMSNGVDKKTWHDYMEKQWTIRLRKNLAPTRQKTKSFWNFQKLKFENLGIFLEGSLLSSKG
jgi:hypothetical protein